MFYLFFAACLSAAIFFSYKYFKQKVAIRLLAESLASRTSILTHSKEFRGTNENWRILIDELNNIIQEVGRLSRQSSGQLNQIETTLGSLQEGVLIIDRDNYVLLVNRALGEVFPSMAAEVGTRLESGARSSEFLEFVRDVKKGRGKARKEISLLLHGKEIWLEVTAAKLAEAPEGDGPWFLFVLHDISKLKRLEVARKQFVANASHELKTPVSVIKGYAETLVSDHAEMDAADRDRFLKTIHRHAERLALLINDLLSLSRLESDTPSFDWRESDLLSWIREMVVEYQASHGDAEVKFDIGYALDDHAIVKFDVLKMRQVFDNLVENAIKYSPSGSSVTIGAQIREDSVQVWVEDQGPGVPKEDLDRIFERFYRVDKGRSRETGGTGLGLSIVKHIVEWHEGRVWAENAEDAEGGGLRVRFALPLARKMSVSPKP